MSKEAMQALDENGEVIEDDNYDELEAALSGRKEDVKEEETFIVPEKGATSVVPEKEGEKGKSTEELDKQTTKVDATVPPDSSVVKDLLLQLRESRKQLAIMQSKLDRIDKRPIPSLLATKEEDEEEDSDDDDLPVGGKKEIPPVKEEKLSDLEQYQVALNTIATERESTFNDLLALMSLNPKYTDVEEVCSRQRFDDIFEAVAVDMVEKEGGDPVAAQMAIELHIWKKPNPYAYMYDLIKKYHPDYAKGSKTVEGEKKKESTKESKLSVTAPLSALDLNRGGGGKNLGEWTAERIDAMPEYELDKVPKDIYNAYLRGELDNN